MTTNIEMLAELRDAWAEGMVRACWQGGLALLAAWVVCHGWPRLSPTIRSWIWRLALIKLLASLLVWPPVEIPLPSSLPTSLAALKSIADVPLDRFVFEQAQVTSTAVGKVSGPHKVAQAKPDHFAWLFFGTWLLGAVSATSWMAVQWKSARGLVDRSVPIGDAGARATLDDLCAKLALRRSPRLLSSDEILGPAIWGLLRPAIVLPSALLQDFERVRMQMLLAHELLHAKRHDIGWNWLRATANVLFWFHPLVWLANRQWYLAQESACDEGALTVTRGSTADYGRFLLDVVERSRLRPRVVSIGIGAGISYQVLQRRLTAMKSLRPLTRRQLLVAGNVFLVVGLVSLIPWRLVVPQIRAAEPTKAAEATDEQSDAEKWGEHAIGPKTATPLAEAVKAFNEKVAQHRFDVEGSQTSPLPKAKWPAPLTEDEVIAAIRGRDRKKVPVTEAMNRIVDKIAESKILPPHAQLYFWEDWRQDDESDKDEYRIWGITLDAMIGKNKGDGFRIRNQKLESRMALKPSPGYRWISGPYALKEREGMTGFFDNKIAVSVDDDKTGALVVHVGQSNEVHDLRAAAFDREGKRYDLRRRQVGPLMDRFRLDPAELPRSKVQFLGVEASGPERPE